MWYNYIGDSMQIEKNKVILDTDTYNEADDQFAIAYIINKDWFGTMKVSCPIINDDNKFKLTEDRHNITFVNYLNANKIFNDLFDKLWRNI